MTVRSVNHLATQYKVEINNDPSRAVQFAAMLEQQPTVNNKADCSIS
jgi:hypothetical protein